MERLLANHPDTEDSLALLLTSDEEGDAVDGTVRVVEALRARKETIDFCIVGEPTCVEHLGDTIKNGRRGSLSACLVVKGVQGHVAYPHLVKNPVHLAAPALAELAAMTRDAGNDNFPPTSFQISNAHAGTGAGNVVPGRFEILFNFRFSTASSVEGLQSRVHALLDRHGLEYDIRWTLGAKPFLTQRGDLCAALTDAIATEVGVTASLSTTGGTSDGRFIADICPQLVEFGPVNASIHKVDECIAVADLEPLARIYEHTFERLIAA
jgi:succinyl-diaminopimelate desuccinylase